MLVGCNNNFKLFQKVLPFLTKLKNLLKSIEQEIFHIVHIQKELQVQPREVSVLFLKKY